MLSEKAKLQLQMFLNTLEKETGIKADYLQVYQHRGTEEHAVKLENQGFEMEAEKETTWAAMNDIINECRFRACYFYEPEELEEEPPKCDVCENELTEEEQLSPFLENMCVHCTKEQQNELIQQNKDYRHSVI